MRLFPRRRKGSDIYIGMCCAYEHTQHSPFEGETPKGETLYEINKFVREYLPIKKKVYFKKRPMLWKFLKENKERCCAYISDVLIYIDEDVYWSFEDRDEDRIVCIWYIK